MKTRYEHMDIARGIAIILVVLGHSCSKMSGDDVNRVILSFHMPLFFFISGVFAKKCEINNLYGTIMHKAKTILLPQLLLAATIYILRGVPHFLSGKSLGEFNFLYGIRYWFLPTLFACSVIHILLHSVINIEKKIVASCVIFCTACTIFITLNILDIPNDGWSKFFKLVPVAFFFYMLGFMFKKQALSINDIRNSWHGLILLLLFPILVCVAQLNSPVKMYISEYGIFPLFLLSSILGIIIVVTCSKHIMGGAILQEFGKMSIAVYVWNFLIIGCSNVLLIQISKILGVDINNFKAPLIFLISMVALYCISKYSLKKYPMLYGQKKQQ